MSKSMAVWLIVCGLGGLLQKKAGVQGLIVRLKSDDLCNFRKVAGECWIWQVSLKLSVCIERLQRTPVL